MVCGWARTGYLRDDVLVVDHVVARGLKVTASVLLVKQRDYPDI